MLIKPPSIESLKELWVKILLSRTDKVTKVSDGSVLNGIAYASAKLSQKALKDIALAQSHFYPSTSHGPYLDNIANEFGISARFGAAGSSTYLRLVGTPGTQYIPGIHRFSGSNGIIWNLDSFSVIGSEGFVYVRVSSASIGSNTIMDPLTITNVNPIPVGHNYVINEYQTLGGRDQESDDDFRLRIQGAINLLARPTLDYLKQVMLKFRPDILRVFNYGDNGNGKIRLGLVLVTGQGLTNAELDSLLQQITPWFSLSESLPTGLPYVGVELVNVIFQPIDISFRAQLNNNYNPDVVRKNVQIRINKYIDYRTWKPGEKIEWDDLLQIVKNTEGVNYVPDQFFYPNSDLSTDPSRLPRVRGFLMLDMDGVIVSNGGGTLNPVYYPTVADFSFISNVLSGL